MKYKNKKVNSYVLIFEKEGGEEIKVTLTYAGIMEWSMKLRETLNLSEIAEICEKVYEETGIENTIAILRENQPSIYVHGPDRIKEELLRQVSIIPRK